MILTVRSSHLVCLFGDVQLVLEVVLVLTLRFGDKEPGRQILGDVVSKDCILLWPICCECNKCCCCWCCWCSSNKDFLYCCLALAKEILSIMCCSWCSKDEDVVERAQSSRLLVVEAVVVVSGLFKLSIDAK